METKELFYALNEGLDIQIDARTDLEEVEGYPVGGIIEDIAYKIVNIAMHSLHDKDQKAFKKLFKFNVFPSKNSQKEIDAIWNEINDNDLLGGWKIHFESYRGHTATLDFDGMSVGDWVKEHLEEDWFSPELDIYGEHRANILDEIEMREEDDE